MALGVCAAGRAPVVVAVLGAAVAIAGGLTLGEYLFRIDLRIDQLLLRSYIATETSHAGRMSPVSAFCFTLAGVALVVLGAPIHRRWKGLAAGSLASVVVSISVVALLGYALGLPGTYGWGQLTRIAMHTASAFGLLGAGLFIVAWQVACRDGEHTPRWLPVPLGLAVFTASLVFYFALESKQDEEIGQTVKASAESVQNQISIRMESRIRSLVRMTRRWELSGESAQPAWEADAADYLHDLPDVEALAWYDPAHRMRWMVPQDSPEAARNAEGDEDRHAAIRRAEQKGQPVVSHAVRLARSELGFVVYVPVRVDGQSRGMLAATFNAKSCLDRYLPHLVAAGEAIRISEGQRIFYERDAIGLPDREGWFVDEKVELPGASWDLRVWPTPALAKRLTSPLPECVLCAGALGAILLAGICYFAQRASRHAAETTRTNAALQTALGQVKTLEGLLPICCGCKRVRDDTGYWNQIDTYLRRHTKASLSHGYCPECAVKEFERFGLAIPEKIQEELKAGKFE
jgi:sensor domain CHASE-containing protein